MRKILFVFVFVLLLYSCKSVKLVLHNTYIGTLVYLEYHLTLSPDNTFHYECLNGMEYEQTIVSGVWRKEGSYLFLHSQDTLMSKPLPLNIREFVFMNNDSSTFVLNIPQTDNYINWMLVLNDETYPFSPNSIVSVNTIADTIQQFYLSAERNLEVVLRMPRKTIQTQSYTRQNINNKMIELSIPLSKWEIGNYARYELINDTLVIKKNKLVWPRKNVILKPRVKGGAVSLNW